MERIYFPDRRVQIGFFASWKEMYDEIIRSRELIYRLFIRDFNAKYRQSLLGVSWVFLMPLIMVGIFVYLNQSGILRIQDTGMPYLVFSLIGITLYGLFSGGLVSCSQSIVSAGPMVRKINFPKISLCISAFGQVFVEFLIRIIFISIIFCFFGVYPSWSAIFLPFVVFPMILFTLGIGFLLSILTGLFRDVTQFVSVGTMFLLFLTPVVFPIPSNNWLGKLNPLGYFINACRDIYVKGTITDIYGFLGASVFSFFVFLILWRLFYLSEPKIVEKI